MNYILDASGVTKNFSGKMALREVELKIGAGETFGLIGRNGAGKTTFIKIVLGFLRQSSGEVSLFGERPGRFPGRAGYLPEQADYHATFTGREYLSYIAGFSGVEGQETERRVADLLALTGIEGAADRVMSRYSKGMLQRLGIAQSMITSPEFLVLDEPFSGLDPSGQRDLCDMIVRLKSLGKTILVCSHILSHLEKVCDGVAIIDGGRIIRSGPVASLLLKKDRFRLEAENVGAGLFDSLRARFALERAGGGRFFFEERAKGDKESLLGTLVENGAVINELAPCRETLDDFFNGEVSKAEGGGR